MIRFLILSIFALILVGCSEPEPEKPRWVAECTNWKPEGMFATRVGKNFLSAERENDQWVEISKKYVCIGWGKKYCSFNSKRVDDAQCADAFGKK